MWETLAGGATLLFSGRRVKCQHLPERSRPTRDRSWRRRRVPGAFRVSHRPRDGVYHLCDASVCVEHDDRGQTAHIAGGGDPRSIGRKRTLNRCVRKRKKNKTSRATLYEPATALYIAHTTKKRQEDSRQTALDRCMTWSITLSIQLTSVQGMMHLPDCLKPLSFDLKVCDGLFCQRRWCGQQGGQRL